MRHAAPAHGRALGPSLQVCGPGEAGRPAGSEETRRPVPPPHLAPSPSFHRPTEPDKFGVTCRRSTRGTGVLHAFAKRRQHLNSPFPAPPSLDSQDHTEVRPFPVRARTPPGPAGPSARRPGPHRARRTPTASAARTYSLGTPSLGSTLASEAPRAPRVPNAGARGGAGDARPLTRAY